VNLGDLFPIAFIFSLSYYIGRAWIRWSRTVPRFSTPRWRTMTTFCGFVSAAISLAIIALQFVYSLFGGSLVPTGPMWAIAMLLGLATAGIGVIAALVGTGQLEIPTVVCSVLCLLAWIAHGLAS
jgi:hypothetical protein